MKARAVIRLNFCSEKQLKVVQEALIPEIKTSNTTRSKIDMKAEERGLVLEFKAKDISALRAALNSSLRLIGVAMNLQKLAEES